MATNSNEIKGFIMLELAKQPALFNVDHPPLLALIDAIATGVYEGMKKLDDKTGTPPSTGHE